MREEMYRPWGPPAARKAAVSSAVMAGASLRPWSAKASWVYRRPESMTATTVPSPSYPSPARSAAPMRGRLLVSVRGSLTAVWGRDRTWVRLTAATPGRASIAARASSPASTAAPAKSLP